MGKTTVATMLAGHGALIVDCDQLGRDVVAPGGSALPAIFDRFGPDMKAEDGSLDRAALAGVVFNDASALADLNAITHPAIDVLIENAIADAEGRNPRPIVVLDMAVLVETSLGAGLYDTVIVVEAPLDVRIERLGERGMAADDAKARIASQASDEERRAVADAVVVNDGSMPDLALEVDRIWAEIAG